MNASPQSQTATPVRSLALLMAAVLLLGMAGCGGGSTESTSTDSPAPAATVTGTTTSAAPPSETATPAAGPDVAVYFMNDDATRLVLASRPGPVTDSPLRAALVALANGPSPAGAIAAIPPGTKVVGTDIRGGEALINFSRAFAAGYPSGGAAAEAAVIAPIVFTATEIDGVERVRITVDGAVPALAGSQYDWSRSFSREDFAELEVVEG